MDCLVYDRLFEVDENFNVTSRILSDWYYSKNEDSAGVWVLKVREGIQMHDGSTLTAQDVAYSVSCVFTSERHKHLQQQIGRVYSSAYNGEVYLAVEGADNAQLPQRMSIPVIKSGSVGDEIPVGSGPYMYNEDRTALVKFDGYENSESLPLNEVQLRAYRGMEELITEIVKHGLPTDNMMFCTDDKHIENIRREGHINCIARMAVKCGMDPIQAVKMASYNAARAYGLRNIGAIAPGYKGDMVLFEDLKDFRVLKVFTRFGRPYDGKPTPMPIIPQAVYTSMNMAPIPEDGLRLPAKEIMPVICQIEGQLVTERRDLPVCRDAEGNFVSGNGLNKLAVIERHHALGNIGLGIVQGFNIHGGAIASTVAHDSHNLVMVGDNDDDMLLAAESLRECGGGFCVVSHGIVLARLPLPIAGLMTDAPVDSVLEIQRALLDAAAYIGVDKKSDPLVALSFLALPVIPAIRLTDKGLFDSASFKFIEI